MHTTHEVYQAYERLNIEPILNVPYAFYFQPIELVFAQVKLTFKKAKLHAFTNNKPFSYEDEI